MSSTNIVTDIKNFFIAIREQIKRAINERKKRHKAINVAQSRMSEDGSPTYPYEIAKKVPPRRLEPQQ